MELAFVTKEHIRLTIRCHVGVPMGCICCWGSVWSVRLIVRRAISMRLWIWCIVKSVGRMSIGILLWTVGLVCVPVLMCLQRHILFSLSVCRYIARHKRGDARSVTMGGLSGIMGNPVCVRKGSIRICMASVLRVIWKDVWCVADSTFV